MKGGGRIHSRRSRSSSPSSFPPVVTLLPDGRRPPPFSPLAASRRSSISSHALAGRPLPPGGLSATLFWPPRVLPLYYLISNSSSPGEVAERGARSQRCRARRERGPPCRRSALTTTRPAMLAGEGRMREEGETKRIEMTCGATWAPPFFIILCVKLTCGPMGFIIILASMDIIHRNI